MLLLSNLPGATESLSGSEEPRPVRAGDNFLARCGSESWAASGGGEGRMLPSPSHCSADILNIVLQHSNIAQLILILLFSSHIFYSRLSDTMYLNS